MSESKTTFEINGEKYDVIKRGLAQAKQIAGLTRWLSKYGAPAFRKLSEGGFESMGGFEIAIAVGSALDENALIELFETVFGCSRVIAEQDFDVMLLWDGAVAVYNESPVVRKLADRFFLVTPSADTEDSNSTQSDPPTDG